MTCALSVVSSFRCSPFNPITAPSLLKHWRDCLKNAPRELYTNLTLAAGPSFAGHAVIIQFLWCGKTRSEGEMLLQAILSWEGETCILKDVEERPYADQQENASQILSSKGEYDCIGLEGDTESLGRSGMSM